MLKDIAGINYNINRLNKHFLDYSRQNIDALNKINEPVSKVGYGIGQCTNNLLKFQLVGNAFGQLQQSINNVIEPGIKLITSVHDLSVVQI